MPCTELSYRSDCPLTIYNSVAQDGRHYRLMLQSLLRLTRAMVDSSPSLRGLWSILLRLCNAKPDMEKHTPQVTQQLVEDQPTKRHRVDQPAVSAGLQDLPDALLAVIYCKCDLLAQRRLAHSSSMFRMLWKDLDLPQDNAFKQSDSTASSRWAQAQTESAVEEVQARMRLDLNERPCKSSLLPGTHEVLCASLVGHLCQNLLAFAVKHAHTDIPGTEFQSSLRKIFEEALPGGVPHQVSMLTFQLHHTRQAGFSDEELDGLGFFFRHVPGLLADHIRADQVFEGGCIVCTPTWQLVAPDGCSLDLFWLTDINKINLVASAAALGIA